LIYFTTLSQLLRPT